MRRGVFSFCAALLAALGGSKANSAPMYTITGIAPLSGTTQSVATGINDSGQVTGVSYTKRGEYPNTYDSDARSFLYSGGNMSQVAPVGGDLAHGITASGTVYGGNVVGINASGETIGQDSSTGYNYIKDSDGTVLATWIVQTQDKNFVPLSINDSGQVAGIFGSSGGIWCGGLFHNLSSGLDAFGSTAFAINSQGDVLIDALTNYPSSSLNVHTATDQSFLYTHTGQLISLSGATGYEPGLSASALNDKDQVIGYQQITTQVGSEYVTNYTKAFLYRDGKITLLNDLLPANSGWDLIKATGINDLGQIVGQGIHDGQVEAFVLSPGDVPSVPEPGALAIATFAIIALAIRSKACQRIDTREIGGWPELRR